MVVDGVGSQDSLRAKEHTQAKMVLTEEDDVTEFLCEQRTYEEIEQLTVPELKLISTYLKSGDGGKVPGKR